MIPVSKTTTETPDARVRVDALSDAAVVGADDVCALLDIGVRTVYDRVKSGELPPPFLMGRLRKWHLGTLRAFLRARAEAAATPKGGEA